ncbi:MAG: hypothetical protein LBK54_06685 [Propionibacteriaceae bacterium]|jgi:hypothetical protein|nr:hypothetical protein [Propionibacteriaceae bacterium]
MASISEAHGLTTAQEAKKAAEHVHALAVTASEDDNAPDIHRVLGELRAIACDLEETLKRLDGALAGKETGGTDDGSDASQRIAAAQTGLREAARHADGLWEALGAAQTNVGHIRPAPTPVREHAPDPTLAAMARDHAWDGHPDLYRQDGPSLGLRR